MDSVSYTHLDVYKRQMKWRLKSLGYFSQAEATKIDDAAIRVELQDEVPNLLSESFVKRLEWAIQNGERCV